MNVKVIAAHSFATLIERERALNFYYEVSFDQRIFPKIVFSLEEAMEYIRGDEFLEVTPESLRMRKA